VGLGHRSSKKIGIGQNIDWRLQIQPPYFIRGIFLPISTRKSYALVEKRGERIPPAKAFALRDDGEKRKIGTSLFGKEGIRDRVK